MLVFDLAFTLTHLGSELLGLGLEVVHLLFEVAVVLALEALLLGSVEGGFLAAVDFL